MSSDAYTQEAGKAPRGDPGINKVPTLRATWRLLQPFFASRHRWLAAILVGLLVAESFLQTSLSLWQNTWYGRWMDTLAARDNDHLMPLLGTFGLIMASVLTLYAAQTLVTSWLDILWRQWATHRFLDRWLSRDAFYRIEREQSIDNPDQRITEDISAFMDHTRRLSFGALSALVSLVAFSGRLWELSGPLGIPMFGSTLTVPGYLLWVALFYSLLTTGVVHLVTRALMRAEFGRQRAEANFRYMAAGVREHAEQIALYHGSEAEAVRLKGGFEAVRRNFWQIVRVKMRSNPVTNVLFVAATIVPTIAAIPAFIAGHITIGQMLQIGSAFGVVNIALSWFASEYTEIQTYRVVVARLYGLEVASRPATEPTRPDASVIDHREDATPAISIERLSLHTPNGRVLTEPISMRVGPKERWLIWGPSGVGKSTLMRAMAGIWPYGEGRISVPAGARLLFLPQKSYVPPGSLRAAVCYPSEEGAFTDEACRDALRTCGLAEFEHKLDEVARWGQQLSLGEQQRLAVARALLQRPDYLLMDEATSALDPRNEQLMYHVLLLRLPDTALISIAHHSSVEVFHPHAINMSAAVSTGVDKASVDPQAPGGDRLALVEK